MKYPIKKLVLAYTESLKFVINPIGSEASDVKGQVAFNMALDMVNEFIKKADNNELPKEYLDALVRD